jgi:hypothetical protein
VLHSVSAPVLGAMRIQGRIHRLSADQGIIGLAAHPISLRTIEGVCRGEELLRDVSVSGNGFFPCVKQLMGGSALPGQRYRYSGGRFAFA